MTQSPEDIIQCLTNWCLSGLREVHKLDISELQVELYSIIEEADNKSHEGPYAVKIIIALYQFCQIHKLTTDDTPVCISVDNINKVWEDIKHICHPE